jgi:hypothetical protein
LNLLSRDNLRKLDPNVFTLAAERIQDGRNTLSCCSVEVAAQEFRKFYGPYVNAYKAAFGPFTQEGEFLGGLEASKHPYWNKDISKRRQQLRISALLTMAEIVRASRR